MQNQEQHNKENEQQELGFWETVHQLPKPLVNKFLKYLLAAIAALILVIIMLAVGKESVYLWGLLFPVFFSYLALSLVWDWADGKIACKRMLCVKAKRQPGEQLYLILRDLDAEPGQSPEMYKFHIPVGKKDAELFSEDTILQVYFNPRQVGEMIAWEIIGNQ